MEYIRWQIGHVSFESTSRVTLANVQECKKKHGIEPQSRDVLLQTRDVATFKFYSMIYLGTRRRIILKP